MVSRTRQFPRWRTEHQRCLKLNNASVGTPQFFGFQLPTNPLSTLTVTLIDGNRDYQAKTAPVITDEGLNMYWSVSRSKVYGWVGDGTGRTDFTTNGVNNFGFTRDIMPFSSAASTTPSLSSSTGPEGFVVGTGASNEIWVWDRNFTDVPIVVPTAALVTSRLLVSPDDVFVYFATPAPDSSLYQVSSADLAQTWKLTLSGGIAGDIAQTKNGARIIVADSVGAVTAFSVATADEALLPISAPPSPPTTTIPVASIPTIVAPVVTTATPSKGSTSLPDLSQTPTVNVPPSQKPLSLQEPTEQPTKLSNPNNGPTTPPTSAVPVTISPPASTFTIVAGVVAGVVGSIATFLLIVCFFMLRKKCSGSTSTHPSTVHTESNVMDRLGTINGHDATSPAMNPRTSDFNGSNEQSNEVNASLITPQVEQLEQKHNVHYKDQARTMIGQPSQQILVQDLQSHQTQIPLANAIAMDVSGASKSRPEPPGRLLNDV